MGNIAETLDKYLKAIYDTSDIVYRSLISNVDGIAESNTRENPTMTSDTVPEGLVFYSSQNAGNDGFHVFDDNQLLYWMSVPEKPGETDIDIDEYIGYIFTTAKNIAKYTFLGFDETVLGYSETDKQNLYNALPKTWRLEASNDTTDGSNGTWVILDSWVDFDWAGLDRDEVLITDFEFDVPYSKQNAYLAYRIWVVNTIAPSITSPYNNLTNLVELVFYPQLSQPQNLNLGAIGSTLEWIRKLSISLLAQLSLTTAEDKFLDFMIHDHIGIVRFENETDSEYRERVRNYIIAYKVSRAAIIYHTRPYSNPGEPQLLDGVDDAAFADVSFSDVYTKFRNTQAGPFYDWWVFPAITTSVGGSAYFFVLRLENTDSADIAKVIDLVNRWIASGIAYELQIVAV